MPRLPGQPNTRPSISLRAVRSTATRFTSVAVHRRHDRHLAGRMLDRQRLFAALAGSPRSSAAGEPGSRQAVATLTAPSTPIAAWQRCGMKVRVAIAPPCRGGATSIIFGTDFAGDVAEVHQRPGLQPDRLDPRPQRLRRPRASSGASSPATPRSAARITTQGMPLSISVQATPSITSTALPVGSSAPQLEPAVSREVDRHRRGGAGHAVDARVAGIAHPAARRLDGGDRDLAGVLHEDAHLGLAVRARATSPRSIANGPTPARMLPQFCASVTIGLVDEDLQEQVVDVDARRARTARPPRPSRSAGRRRPCRRSGAGRASP